MKVLTVVGTRPEIIRLSRVLVRLERDADYRLVHTGQNWDPMRVGVTRAFFVSESEREREEALERRLANRTRQLKLATTPDGTVLGGPDRAGGDPIEVNLKSAIYGTPDQIARRLQDLQTAGVGYVLINGGGSGGGERGRRSLRRFAREIMPAFTEQQSNQAAD